MRHFLYIHAKSKSEYGQCPEYAEFWPTSKSVNGTPQNALVGRFILQVFIKL